MANKMINENDFSQMHKDISEFDKSREILIKDTRDILVLSKQAIYSVHRNELDMAKEKIDEMKKAVENLIVDDKLKNQGSHKAAIQEYVEAVLFYDFATGKSLTTSTQLNLDAENYLLGLCDLSGEIVRFAVNKAINDEIIEVKRSKELLDEIYGQLLKFDFRNSELRKKFDSIKWSVKKMEEIMFDLKIKSRLE